MPQTLDYAQREAARRVPGRGGAVLSLCLGLIVCAEAIWALCIGLRLDRNGMTEAWSMLGALLLTGAFVAAIGLAVAVGGRRGDTPPMRLRRIGGILNALYLAAYATLIASLLIYAR